MEKGLRGVEGAERGGRVEERREKDD